jgi:OFA family oxalate/formate antiporter-like MFS transporter
VTRAWISLALISALFFIITATTFDSLGLVLPAMVGELGWSWTQAGLGYTLLGVFCGITATIPAFLIRRMGLRAALLVGACVMALAFACLGVTSGKWVYFAGTSLAGLGFTLLDTVPGTYLLARLFKWPSFAIGLYFTIGGLGAAFAPLLYYGVVRVSGAWRDYWLVAGVLVVAIAVLTAALVDTRSDAGAGAEADPDISRESWTAAAAMKTPQFWILAAAYSAFLFCGITANSVSVAHLTQRGVAAVAAGGMIGVSGLINAGARLAGGLLTRVINARILLMVSLASLIIGLLALANAHDMTLMLVYAAGIGIGYGLTFFASTILLLDYFGRRANLELFATVNLISTTGSVAPFLAGMTRDMTGSFAPFFVALAGLMALVLLAVACMRPPHKVPA